MSSTTVEFVKKSEDMMQAVDKEPKPDRLYLFGEPISTINDWDLDNTLIEHKTQAEFRFKSAVYILTNLDFYPSPTRLNTFLCRDPRSRKMNNLNDRECRWRREICKEIGFTLRGKNL